MHYVKIFDSILTSTVWELPAATRIVWFTLMTMADNDGYVRSSVPGLARAANVTREEVDAALMKFKTEDADSTSPEFEGRRIEPVEGGWRLFNYKKYRQMMTDEERKERDRDRKARERAAVKEAA